MPIGRKECRECGARAADGWYISTRGVCLLCAIDRAVGVIVAMFPPDAVPVTARPPEGATVPVGSHPQPGGQG